MQGKFAKKLIDDRFELRVKQFDQIFRVLFFYQPGMLIVTGRPRTFNKDIFQFSVRRTVDSATKLGWQAWVVCDQDGGFRNTVQSLPKGSMHTHWGQNSILIIALHSRSGERRTPESKFENRLLGPTIFPKLNYSNADRFAGLRPAAGNMHVCPPRAKIRISRSSSPARSDGPVGKLIRRQRTARRRAAPPLRGQNSCRCGTTMMARS